MRGVGVWVRLDPGAEVALVGGTVFVKLAEAGVELFFGGSPGFLRFDPKTKLSEVYYIPKPGFGIRGGDIGKDGVLWGSGSSGHLMSFDRRKCKGPLNGPTATGNHCPEGWAFYKYPGPGFDGFPDTSAEAS